MKMNPIQTNSLALLEARKIQRTRVSLTVFQRAQTVTTVVFSKGEEQDQRGVDKRAWSTPLWKAVVCDFGCVTASREDDKKRHENTG